MPGNERLDGLLPPDPGVGRVEPIPLGAAAGAIPTALPKHLRDRLTEPPGPDRSAQTAGLVIAAVEWGLDDAAVLALALAHPPTRERQGKTNVAKDVGRLLAKHRPSHAHVGQPCDKANCPNRPPWMGDTIRVASRSRSAPAATPAASATPEDTASATVADLLTAMRAYQHLDDPAVVWFVLGIATSSGLDGEPLWGMPIGPSSGGKTEAIRVLDAIARRVDELTTAALLTWLPGKTPRPAGALVDIGQRGIVTVSDFSTVLATADRGGRDQLFANLRRVYDGTLTRILGNAPKPLVWEGRLTMIAGCTAAIDRYAAHTDALGPRWLAYRTADRDSTQARARARMAQRNPSTAALRAHARQLADETVKAASAKAATITELDLGEPLLDRILDVAQVTCWGRTTVPRHGYGKREIDGIPEDELPPRVAKQLTMLARCLVALGLGQQRTRWLVEHAGLSSMPSIRRRVLHVLAAGEELGVSEIARRANAHRHPVRFALEELQAIGIADCDARSDDEDGQFPDPQRWRLEGPDASLIADVVGGHPWHEVWGAPPGDTPTPHESGGGGVGGTYVSCQGNASNAPSSSEGL